MRTGPRGVPCGLRLVTRPGGSGPSIGRSSSRVTPTTPPPKLMTAFSFVFFLAFRGLDMRGSHDSSWYVESVQFVLIIKYNFRLLKIWDIWKYLFVILNMILKSEVIAETSKHFWLFEKHTKNRQNCRIPPT